MLVEGVEVETRPVVEVGGQAVMDGVMMRAGDSACVAVRMPDGSIATRSLHCPGWAHRWRGVPAWRGLAALAESLYVGVHALAWSEQQTVTRHDGKRPAPLWLLMLIALVSVISMVVVIPALIAGLLPSGSAGFVAAETAARLGVVGTYLGAVSRRPEVRRVFEYHGAEHLVVAVHERGDTVTDDDVRAGSIRHPRCGTSFLLVIAAVAAGVHPLLPVDPWQLRVGARVIVVPLVAAGAYEIMRWMGRQASVNPGGLAERVLVSPQRFTTRRPDGDQIEVAAVALAGALAGTVDGGGQGPETAPAPTGSSRRGRSVLLGKGI